MQTQLDFVIENIEVIKGFEKVFVTVDPKYGRVRFSEGCSEKLKGLKRGEHFVLGYRKADKSILIPKKVPEGSKSFKIGSRGYTSVPQLFERDPFKSMNETIRFQYNGTENGFYVFKEVEVYGSPIFYV